MVSCLKEPCPRAPHRALGSVVLGTKSPLVEGVPLINAGQCHSSSLQGLGEQALQAATQPPVVELAPGTYLLDQQTDSIRRSNHS